MSAIDSNASFPNRALLAWFKHNKRSLPWRAEPRNPYHVWLSEVMLQQTQVATVTGYFNRWIAELPDIEAVARAPLDHVLKLWEGLGYYSRARNIHRAAQIVCTQHNGQLPSTVEDLLALPGIGRYTAGAITSIAFGQREPVVDGNVRRVLSRFHAMGGNDAEALWSLAHAHLPARNAGMHNEALMELGATVCTPRQPDCSKCPLQHGCRGFASGSPLAYPAAKITRVVPVQQNVTLVIRHRGRFVMRQRQPSGLLGGLWEFPNSDIGEAQATSAQAVTLAYSLGVDTQATDWQEIGVVRHAFSHFKQVRHVFQLVGRPNCSAAETNWKTSTQASALALTRADRRILGLVCDQLQPRSRSR